jgi:hypothetical protein
MKDTGHSVSGLASAVMVEVANTIMITIAVDSVGHGHQVMPLHSSAPLSSYDWEGVLSLAQPTGTCHRMEVKTCQRHGHGQQRSWSNNS